MSEINIEELQKLKFIASCGVLFEQINENTNSDSLIEEFAKQLKLYFNENQLEKLKSFLNKPVIIQHINSKSNPTCRTCGLMKSQGCIGGMYSFVDVNNV